MGGVELQKRFNELQRELEQLPTLTEPPLTVLQILGKDTSELHWESLLAYFLDSSKPHGFETDMLEEFLTYLDQKSSMGFSLDRRDLPHVEIQTQVGTADGIPDILLWVSDEWFLCLELKVRAAETDEQTVRYVDSPWIGEIDKSKYDPSNHHYAYLAGPDADPPESESFIQLSWLDIADRLQDRLNEGRGQYPQKSYAQLRDFVHTINEEFKMTEYKENIDEKAKLRVEFAKEIDQTDQALDEVVEDAQRSWTSDLLAADPVIWDDSWDHAQLGEKYAQVYRQEWLLGNDQKEEPKNADAGAIFQFNVEKEAFLNTELYIILKTTGVTELKDELENYLYSDPIRSQLEEAARTGEATVRDQNDKSEIMYKRIPLRLMDGHTVGGQAAKALDELADVADVVTEAVRDVSNDVNR